MKIKVRVSTRAWAVIDYEVPDDYFEASDFDEDEIFVTDEGYDAIERMVYRDKEGMRKAYYYIDYDNAEPREIMDENGETICDIEDE